MPNTKVMCLIQTDITDPSWIEEYTLKVTPLMEAAGGRYITRTDNIELVEGESRPQVAVVAEFPTKEAALGFYHSDAYAPYRQARLAGSQSQFLIVPCENASEGSQ